MRYNPTDLTSTYAAIAPLNANFDDISTLMERVLFRDGTSPNSFLADLDANHFTIKNLAAPSDPNDPVRLSDLNLISTIVPAYSFFISVKDFGAKGDSDITGATGTDDTTSIQNAINYVNLLGGGTLFLPNGYYKTTSYLTLCKNLHFLGEGKLASEIINTSAGGGGANAAENIRNGTVLYSHWASNGSTAVNIVIESMGLRNVNGANVGAQFYDNGGTFVQLCNVGCRGGGKYGIVLDQTELSDVDLCEFGDHTTGAIWIVGEASGLTAGNSGGFTNRLSFTRNQINESGTCYGVIDDGGNAHSYIDNNFNGCLNHIRAAGVQGLKISGGEYESAVGAILSLQLTALSGTSVGQCGSIWIGGSAYLVPSVTQPVLTIGSANDIVFDCVFMGNTSSAKVVGCGNTSQIYAVNVQNGGGGATFDGRATFHYEVGTNGTTIRTRTNFPIEYAGNQVIGARKTGWSVDTGTAKRTANTTYTAGATLTFSVGYDQAEHTAMATRMAAVEAALQDAMQTIKALKDDLHSTAGHGLIGS